MESLSSSKTGNIATSLNQKEPIIQNSGIIEVIETDERLENIGGLDCLLEEITNKKVIFKHLSLAQSKEVSISLPKGMLITGMPGCGKSMIAKATALEFNVALLRLDMNRLMGNDIEEIESKFRHALETIELAQPCVLMIDEIEKAFIGRDNSHNEIILRLLETFLTSMRERKLAVYVIATANDTLPPELMLNGLFDSVYFVDYPNKIEAESILRKCIDRYYDASFYDWSEINNSVIKEIVNLFFADKCNGFSGAEISSLVGTVAETAFRDLIVSRNIQKNSSLDKHKIIIKKELFFSATHEKRPYVMSNQLNDDKIESRIIRISRLKRDFTLKSASK